MIIAPSDASCSHTALRVRDKERNRDPLDLLALTHALLARAISFLPPTPDCSQARPRRILVVGRRGVAVFILEARLSVEGLAGGVLLVSDRLGLRRAT